MNNIEVAYLPQLLKALSARFTDEPVLKIACLGYPDIVVSQPTYDVLLSPDARQMLEPRENGAALIKLHGSPLEVSFVPTFESLIAAICHDHDIGQKVECIFYDFQTYNGTEIIHDFNDPLPVTVHDSYHLVWNGGTIEHIFDIATAFKNIIYMMKEGGFSYHAAPFNMANHGFYNLCPVFYSDFCAANECTVVHTDLYGIMPPHTTFSVKPSPKRAKIVPHFESFLVTVIEKIKHLDKLQNPVQGRYQNNASALQGEKVAV